ncbi:hypothetical protein B0H16DRAFT_1652559, partial [Mycena metata]
MVIGNAVLKLVKQYKFVGIIFSSVDYDIFSAHYAKKSSKARAVANTTFAAKASIGCLPPYEGIRMYMARIDPHLTFGHQTFDTSGCQADGCEVCLDVIKHNLQQLTDVQHEFLRRLLGLHSRSILAHLASTAYLDSLRLALDGEPGWISDICYVLRSLPTPVQFSPQNLTAETVAETISAIETACSQRLAVSLGTMASRLPLIKGR